MLVDLIHVTTADGHRLHGALELPTPAQDRSSSPPVDAWLCIHGTGSNFYSASTLAGLTPALLAGGAAVLRANTRGHDLISAGPAARRLQGSAFERVNESPLDLAAWVNLLKQRGFARIALLGHSLGAVKAIFSLAAESRPDIAALVAVSPPHLSYAHFCESPRAEAFRRQFALAEEHVRAGHGDTLLYVDFPLATYVTAAGYVDRYGPGEQYNVLPLLDRVGCPTLVTYGSAEVQADVAFRGMPEAVQELSTAGRSLQVAVIAGADHIYTGCHDILSGRILSWLARLARNDSGPR